MGPFAQYLEEGMGLHYTKDRWIELEKKMIPAYKQLGYNDLESCISKLLSKPINHEQITVLAFHLTIGETYFFRDLKRMEILEKHILPEIIQRHDQDKKLRILSAACCTGEEAYSIAIILDRLIPNRRDWDISIIGSDINKEFLNKAEIARYKKWSFRTMPHDVRARYFTAHKNETFTLIPHIKKMVTFCHFNLMEDNYISTFQEMDLILCHNVLIYFSPKQINKTIHQLTQSLIPDGWLSISSIETPFVNEPHLAARNYDGALFFKKTDKAQAIKEEKIIAPPPKPKIVETPIPLRDDEVLLKVVFPDFIKLQQPVIEFHFSKPQEIPAKDDAAELNFEELYHNKQYREIISKLSPLQKDRSQVLLLIRTYANLGELSEATTLCEDALKLDKLDADLHYLLATIRTSQGDIANAIKSLKSTLFLEPNYVAAHYLLGTLEKKEKNVKASIRSFKTALDLLEDFDSDEELLGAEELTASRAKDIIENSLRSCS